MIRISNSFAKEMQLPEPNESLAIFDLDQALSFTGGDPDMLRSILELFAVEGPSQLEAIQDCVETQDTRGIQRAAHQLKGSVVIFGAARAETAALNLEQIAAVGDQAQIAQAWNAMSNEFAKLMGQLENASLQRTLLRSDETSNPATRNPAAAASVNDSANAASTPKEPHQ
jgi:HPt (histidine-containing phosphotransfer) domain-containing protein